ncbi:MAG: glycosyltransferase, partial [Lentisphaeria bacterium]|nr:glycosyltransferase [Lentisphaeria bacterium]
MMPPHSTIKVSIILPVYNAGAALASALDSALGQTLRDIEVVAVDDGSADGSFRLLKERAASDPRLKILQQP